MGGEKREQHKWSSPSVRKNEKENVSKRRKKGANPISRGGETEARKKWKGMEKKKRGRITGRKCVSGKRRTIRRRRKAFGSESGSIPLKGGGLDTGEEPLKGRINTREGGKSSWVEEGGTTNTLK